MDHFDELFGARRETHRPTVPQGHIDLDEIPAFLRELRTAARLTQAQLAQRLERSRDFVSRVERGVASIDMLALYAWGRETGVPLHLAFIDNCTGERTVI